MPNGITLIRARNLPGGESRYRIYMHGTDTGSSLYRARDGRWSLHDPSRPYGNVMQWRALADARHDFERVAARYVFHVTGNGLQRLSDGFRPQDFTQALTFTGREPADA